MDATYEEMDAGIRDTVRLLRNNGFDTTDSGDGSKAGHMGCAIEFPHVFCAMQRFEDFVSQADKAQGLLGDDWTVEASYSAKDQRTFLMCMKYPLSVAP